MIIYLTTGFIWMLSFDSLLRREGEGFTPYQAIFNVLLWPLGMFFAIRGFMNNNDDEL
jgi:hypothetical protein